MRAIALVLALLAQARAGEGVSPESASPPLRDRLSWNARERTAAGSRALAAGRAEDASEAFDVAQRLRPADPRTGYNAGTARIGHDAARASELLDSAARAAPPELAPDAWYNLGTARLAAGEARGAVEAFTEALRRAPGRADAKQNLELALAELARQRQQPQQQEQKPQQEPERQAPQRGEAGEKQDHGEAEDGASEPWAPRDDRSGAGDPQTPRPGAEGEGEGEPRPPGAGTSPGGAQREAQERPLPQFRDLPDMTAEQAAAILRAVEDLERQQRRERARRAAAARAAVEIDW